MKFDEHQIVMQICRSRSHVVRGARSCTRHQEDALIGVHVLAPVCLGTRARIVRGARSCTSVLMHTHTLFGVHDLAPVCLHTCTHCSGCTILHQCVHTHALFGVHDLAPGIEDAMDRCVWLASAWDSHVCSENTRVNISAQTAYTRQAERLNLQSFLFYCAAEMPADSEPKPITCGVEKLKHFLDAVDEYQPAS